MDVAPLEGSINEPDDGAKPEGDGLNKQDLQDHNRPSNDSSNFITDPNTL
jgi:hypothetical protein